MAESVYQLQIDTADRFNCRPKRDEPRSVLQRRKEITVNGSNIPYSPNLLSHPLHSLTREEEEEMQADEMESQVHSVNE